MAIEDLVRARLRQARFERGLTVAEVAVRAGITASTVSRLETGARRLTLAHVERLARALERSTDALLAARPSPVPARDGRTWWPVGPERPDGPRVYRVVLPVEEAVRHQHEGHQWLHLLSGTARLLVGGTDRNTPSRGHGRLLHLGTARTLRRRAPCGSACRLPPCHACSSRHERRGGDRCSHRRGRPIRIKSLSRCASPSSSPA